MDFDPGLPMPRPPEPTHHLVGMDIVIPFPQPGLDPFQSLKIALLAFQYPGEFWEIKDCNFHGEATATWEELEVLMYQERERVTKAEGH